MQRHPEDEALIAAFPQLADTARIAVTLNPASGTPDTADNSVGGPFLWPVGEPWPECSVGHWIYHREPLSEAERHEWQQMEAAREARARNGTGQRHVLTNEEAAAQKRIMNGTGALDAITWERIKRVPVSCPDVYCIAGSRKRKKPPPEREGASHKSIPAASYSPTPLRVQYHRR